MRALLRVDASAAIGSGHLSRCLTLARGLRAAGFDTIDVATCGASEHTLGWIAREGARAIAIDGDELAASRAAAEGASLVVVDGYGFDAALHEALRREDRVVCVVDDLASAPVRGDVVLNGNLYAEELAYDVGKGAVLLCGPAYALVREEMVVARAARLAVGTPGAAGAKPHVLVTMGGADPTAETEKVLEAFTRSAPLEVQVIVGGANPRAEPIRVRAREVAAEAGHDLEVLVDVQDMGARMAWCDVALTASGSTCLELACVGVAAAVIVVADNQRGVAAALVKRGLMDVLGDSASVDASAIAHAIATLVGDVPRRRAMEEAQRACVDGRGKDRAASRLLELVRARG